MSENYWRPKFKPRETSGKGITLLGARRHGINHEWFIHAEEVHNWPDRVEADGMVEISACAECGELFNRLMESEQWRDG